MIERRSVEFRDAELKDMNFRGYAAVFDTPWSERLTEATGYIEKVARGAFRKALSRSGDIPLLWQHDRHQLLATTRGKTMRVLEDSKGLLVEASLPKTGLGQHVREMIERGDVRGMSYGIEVMPGDSTLDAKKRPPERVLRSAQTLLDVTLTWEPAYESTEVELRSAGFVATPLQELLSGGEAQTEPSGNGDTPPDEGKPDAWWGEENPADSEGEPEPAVQRRWWESVLDEYEKEV